MISDTLAAGETPEQKELLCDYAREKYNISEPSAAKIVELIGRDFK